MASFSRDEQMEQPLFLFVVVAGYIIILTLTSYGGIWLCALELDPGAFLGKIYFSCVFHKAEILMRGAPEKLSIFSAELGLVPDMGDGTGKVEYQSCT